jgi:hypothetical protein
MLFIFYPDTYYPHSAAVEAESKERAEAEITNAIIQVNPELDVEGSAARGTWPCVADMVKAHLKFIPPGTVALMDQS